MYIYIILKRRKFLFHRINSIFCSVLVPLVLFFFLLFLYSDYLGRIGRKTCEKERKSANRKTSSSACALANIEVRSMNIFFLTILVAHILFCFFSVFPIFLSFLWSLEEKKREHFFITSLPFAEESSLFHR